MKRPGNCSIWGTPAHSDSIGVPSGTPQVNFIAGFHVTSARSGGDYTIDKQACDELNSKGFDEKVKSRLTTWLIEQRQLGIRSPKVTLEVVTYVKAARPLHVQERANALLKYIAKQTPQIGDEFYFYPTIDTYGDSEDSVTGMLAFSESNKKSELIYLLDFLEESGFLRESSASKPDRRNYLVSPSGYARLAELETKHIDAKQVFVAMWFDPSNDEAYEKGIAPAIRRSGYKAVRIDRKNHNNKIDDEIIAEIRRSRFLVADFTQGSDGARGGVYYEAGFAHGLNIPVIFTCRKDSMGSVHFDTRQYNHIVWKTPDELSNSLELRIGATIGDGPLKRNEET